MTGLRVTWKKRKQYTFANHAKSEIREINIVPQDSALGPILCLIYVNDRKCFTKNEQEAQRP